MEGVVLTTDWNNQSFELTVCLLSFDVVYHVLHPNVLSVYVLRVWGERWVEKDVIFSDCGEGQQDVGVSQRAGSTNCGGRVVSPIVEIASKVLAYRDNRNSYRERCARDCLWDSLVNASSCFVLGLRVWYRQIGKAERESEAGNHAHRIVSCLDRNCGVLSNCSRIADLQRASQSSNISNLHSVLVIGETLLSVTHWQSEVESSTSVDIGAVLGDELLVENNLSGELHLEVAAWYLVLCSGVDHYWFTLSVDKNCESSLGCYSSSLNVESDRKRIWEILTYLFPHHCTSWSLSLSPPGVLVQVSLIDGGCSRGAVHGRWVVVSNIGVSDTNRRAVCRSYWCYRFNRSHRLNRGYWFNRSHRLNWSNSTSLYSIGIITLVAGVHSKSCSVETLEVICSVVCLLASSKYWQYAVSALDWTNKGCLIPGRTPIDEGWVVGKCVAPSSLFAAVDLSTVADESIRSHIAQTRVVADLLRRHLSQAQDQN